MQYGGKITDNLDRRLFKTYAETWMGPAALTPSFCFNPGTPMQGASRFSYIIPESQEVKNSEHPRDDASQPAPGLLKNYRPFHPNSAF